MRGLREYPLARRVMALASGFVLLSLATGCIRSPSSSEGPADQAYEKGGSAVEQSSLGSCGERIATGLGRDGPLVLSGTFPERVSGSQDRFAGTVTVTNRGDAPVAGVSAGAADVFLTLAGQVIATPFDQEDSGLLVEFVPGASHAFTATGRLLRCPDDKQRLAPGHYEIYALLSVTHGSGGRTLPVVGGPWPLEVT